jgi:hypothetical protein
MYAGIGIQTRRNYMRSDTMTGMFLAGFGIFIFVFILVFILFAIGFYVLKAIGIYRLAQRRGIDHAWVAWIPFAQNYVYAEIIGQELTVGKYTIPQFPWIYIVMLYGSSIVAGILSIVPFIGWVLAALLGPVIYVAYVYVMYRFFKIFEGDNAVVNTVICTIFPVVFPIMVLVMREKAFAVDAVNVKQV